MKNRFRVTYEIVTPESAEIGEADEMGFVTPGGWKTDTMTALCYSSADYSMSLREALRLCSPSGDCGAFFYESDGREDYHTGAIETRSLHPPRNTTLASWKRLRRLLKIRL